MNRLNRILSKHSGKPVSVVEKAMDRDLFMDTQTALEFGIIDTIMENRQDFKATTS
jgi:ATP-dependent Clp protease protease subunit